MEKYKNLSGQSNVGQYQIGDDFIIVKFKTKAKDGCDTYTYTCISAGHANVDLMKKLALDGFGLNSFINKSVKKNYATKN